MRVIIHTDLEELTPDLATIDVCWEDPPASVKERWLSVPGLCLQTLAGDLIIHPQIYVDMFDLEDFSGHEDHVHCAF